MKLHSVSPLAVRIMLACYYSPDPAREVGVPWASQAGTEIRTWLLNEGLIANDTSLATERGKAWVEFLLQTPLPVAKWTLPERSPAVSEWRIQQAMREQNAA